MIFGLVLDPVYLEHETPAGHPERPERIGALLKGLDTPAWEGKMQQVAPRQVETEWLLCVHNKEHVERVMATHGKAHFAFDPDTFAGPNSYRVASLAAGSGIVLLQQLSSETIQSGMLLVRPPGHHAESNRAMGFCLFNNVAVAAEWAIREQLAERLAIIDFDVHHGNGTQEIFYQRPDVLYISSHQYPFYPGTGALTEIGEEAGEGYTLNLPLRAGSDETFVTAAYEEFVVSALLQYKPDLILVSAGYDVHYQDPLGGLQMTEEGISRLVYLLNEAAAETCQGRVLYFLEGGYNLQALTECVKRTIEVTIQEEEVPSLGPPPPEYNQYRKDVRAVISRYWD